MLIILQLPGPMEIDIFDDRIVFRALKLPYLMCHSSLKCLVSEL